MIDYQKDTSSLENIMIATEDYTSCHENLKKFECRLYYKNRSKNVYSKWLQDLEQRITVMNDLESFESDSGVFLSDGIICYLGLERNGYYSHYTADYERFCEVAKMYAEKYDTAVYLVSHFKETKPGTLTRLPEHVHVVYAKKGISFERFIDDNLDMFVDNEK